MTPAVDGEWKEAVCGISALGRSECIDWVEKRMTLNTKPRQVSWSLKWLVYDLEVSASNLSGNPQGKLLKHTSNTHQTHLKHTSNTPTSNTPQTHLKHTSNTPQTHIKHTHLKHTSNTPQIKHCMMTWWVVWRSPDTKTAFDIVLENDLKQSIWCWGNLILVVSQQLQY